MQISEDITATLRAQDHGHPPVICFEPGIAKREGSDSRFVLNKCGTLRAEMGDNQPAVCFRKSTKAADSEGGDVWVEDCISNTLNGFEFHSQVRTPEIVCCAIDSHPMDSRFGIAGDIAPTVTSKLVKGSADGPLVLLNQ